MSIQVEVGVGQRWRWNGKCRFDPSMYTTGREYEVLSIDGHNAYLTDNDGTEANNGSGHQWPLDADFYAWFDFASGAPAEAASRRIYLSGPMKGYPQSNYPLFTYVAAQLRAAGHTVYNPSEFPHDGEHETFPLRKAFAEYAKFICEEADTIVLLPGWEASLGVSAELALAKNCRLEVVEFKDLKISFD